VLFGHVNATVIGISYFKQISSSCKAMNAKIEDFKSRSGIRLIVHTLDTSSSHTAISRKVVGKDVHATIPKGNMGYVQYTVPDTVAVEPTFVAFL